MCDEHTEGAIIVFAVHRLFLSLRFAEPTGNSSTNGANYVIGFLANQELRRDGNEAE